MVHASTREDGVEDHRFAASLGYIARPFRSRQVSPLAILYHSRPCIEGRMWPGGASDWKQSRSSVGRVGQLGPSQQYTASQPSHQQAVVSLTT